MAHYDDDDYGCDSENFDNDTDNEPCQCPECDHEGVLADFAEVPHANPRVFEVRCPECNETFEPFYDDSADRAYARAEAGYPDA